VVWVFFVLCCFFLFLFCFEESPGYLAFSFFPPKTEKDEALNFSSPGPLLHPRFEFILFLLNSA